MIDTERIVPAPPFPEVRPPEPHPIGEDALKIHFQTRISRFASRIPQGSVNLSLPQDALSLFEIGEQSEGYIFTENEKHPGFRMERVVLQRIGIEVMAGVGLDVDSQPVEVSLTPHDNGMISEHTRYASTTIKGLSFDRWYDFVAETKEPVSVRWELTDRHETVDRELVDRVRASAPIAELERRIPGMKESVRDKLKKIRDDVIDGGAIRN